MSIDQSTAGLWALAIALWFVASVAYRIGSGKGLFARPSPGAVFVERWASGRAGTGPIARLSTARNCLQVQVTGSELLVSPHFPFSLGFMPEIYDYDKRIALDAVRKVTRLDGRLADTVEIAYGKPDGSQALLLLRLTQSRRFLERIQGPGAAASPQ
jgi:hypothetical protein